MAEFKDHFSQQSADYSHYRPSYPAALYDHLAGVCRGHDRALDCATGTGQAARGLSALFGHITAIDGSTEQIAQAEGAENITFRVATAEETGLTAASVDLVTVAQALHWFDHDAFFQEMERIVKPGGILAVWTYNLLEIDDNIDQLIHKLSEDIVGSFWPPERHYVRDNYATIDFPFTKMDVPPFHMTAVWSLDGLMGYLGTWSSVVRYRNEKGRDPLVNIHAELIAAWGDPKVRKKVTWPLSFKVGRF